MKLNRNWLIALALSCSVFCESMAYTYVQQEGNTFFYSSSILYVLAGILICILPLLTIPGTNLKVGTSNQIRRLLPGLVLVFLVVLFVFHVYTLFYLYQQVPVTPKIADMIPVIQLACKRLLHGQPVYAPTPEIWPGTINAYLPMMWLPYLPAEIFGYDLRWTTVTFLFVGLFIAATPIFKAKNGLPVFPTLITTGSLFLVLNFFLTHNTSFWTMTEEGVVTGFYIFLGFALLRRNYYLTGIGMAFCLLSRYALLPWIPACLLFVYFTESNTNFKKLFFTFSGIVLLVFIIPYFIWDPVYFLGLPGVQLTNVEVFWRINGLTSGTYFSVGLFKFFTLENARLMGKIGLLLSFISPMLFVTLAQSLQKRYPLNSRYIAFGSLKLSLIFFYNFIPMPYGYLFFPLTLISYVVLFDFLSVQITTETIALCFEYSNAPLTN